MATLLKPFRFAWKDLNDALNKIVNAVNRNAPLEGTGIHLDETGGQGVRINRQDSNSGNTGDTAAKQQQGSGTQDPHLLADSIEWFGVKWQDVTVVDPSTCAQSPLSVLIHTGNNNDSIVIKPVKYPFWVQPV